MTVEELKELLKDCPDKAKVYCSGLELDCVAISPEYPIGDSANPNCKYETVVILG